MSAQSNVEGPPPAERTVGQLVAESIRLYGRRFWRSLALGIVPAVLVVLVAGRSYSEWLVLMATAGALGLSTSYVGAVAIAAGVRLDRRVAMALLAGFLAFLPVPFLLYGAVLPAVAWLGLVGLVVPVVLLEGRGLRDGFRRAFELARTDYIHAFGSLCALVIVVVLSIGVLVFLLLGAGQQTSRIAFFLANMVVSPLLFLGAALLYFDQEARLESRSRRERSRDADVHHAQQPDRSGRADSEVESRPAEGGQQGR